MRRFCKRALAVLTAAAMLSAGSSALAAEGDAGISVQLDGQTLTFSDAAPEARDGRTFLPVRAVFEAMGAQVSYDAAAGAVTAVRDGTTVTMTLGSTTASVEEGGITVPVVMDVAPYAHGNRTYVPVRFAAQAFGCNVGWDQANSTAIIVDVDQLLGETTYTLMDNYMSYLQEHSRTGNQASEGTVDLSLFLDSSLTGSEEDVDMAFSGSLTGVSSQTAAQMEMALDLSDLAYLAASDPASMTQEEMNALEDLLANMELEVRMDMEAGTCYLYLPFAASAGESGWYSMDLNALFAQSGLDMADLLALSQQDISLSEVLRQTLAATEITDSATGYAMLTQTADVFAKLFGDSAFTKSGDTYTATYSETADGSTITCTTTLTAQGDDIVSMTMKMSAAAEGMEMGMDMSASATESDVTMTMDLSGLMTLEMAVNSAVSATNEVPATGLPAGVNATPIDLGISPAA